MATDCRHSLMLVAVVVNVSYCWQARSTLAIPPNRTSRIVQWIALALSSSLGRTPPGPCPVGDFVWQCSKRQDHHSVAPFGPSRIPGPRSVNHLHQLPRRCSFTHHGTCIIGFSAASKHMVMAPERATMIRFEQVMRERGTEFGTMLACQPWTKPFDCELLDVFVQHQLEEKQNITSFWCPKS